MGRIRSRLRDLIITVAIASVFISQTTFALPSQVSETGRSNPNGRWDPETVGDQPESRSELTPRNSNPEHPIPVHHHYFQPREATPDSNDLDTLTAFEAPIAPAIGGKKRRDDHHFHHPDDHSRGGHSQHWLDHHGLKAASHHPHHHHHSHHRHHHHHHHNRQRGKGPGPSRLAQDPNVEVNVANLIAPPAAQSVAVPEDEEVGGALHSRALDRATKEDTGRGAQSFDGDEISDSSSRLDGGYRDRAGKRGVSKDDYSIDGVSGIIDLMRGSSSGEKLGGLSISSLPPNDTNPISASNLFVLLIDSTPNLIDQATFFMHTFEDQSTFDHEEPSTKASRDLLVALEVPHMSNNSVPRRMCATFDPLDVDAQMFGLALCMDQDSAVNNRRMSQAFRYSPETGILAPYYGAEGARDSVLAAVNERILAMELSEDKQPPNQSGWNGTGIYDLDPNVPALPSNWTNHATSGSDLDPAAIMEGDKATYTSLSKLAPRSVSYLASATTGDWSSKIMPTATSIPTPLLSVHDTSVSNHPFIIGEPPLDTASTASVGTPMGVVMVFRSNMESSSWCRTSQDVDTPVERQKSLEHYQEIGVASKNATRLDHWAAVDKIQPNKMSSKGGDSGNNAHKTGHVASGDPTATKPSGPVGYWSDPGLSQSSGEEQEGNDVEPNEDDANDNANVDEDPLPPKPVLNVAYFGDSGRSAPVPPDQQADFARPILVADPLAKPHTTSKLETGPKYHEKSEEAVSTVHPTWPSYNSQVGQGSAPGVMAAMPNSRIGPMGIPIDASD